MSRSVVTLHQISMVVCSLSCKGYSHVDFKDRVIHGVHHTVKLSRDYKTVEFIMGDKSITLPTYAEHGVLICDVGEMPLTLVVWNEAEKNWNLYTSDQIIEQFLKVALTRKHIREEEEKIDAMLADLQNI